MCLSSNVLDDKHIVFHAQNRLWRWQGLTVWVWILQGVYFASALFPNIHMPLFLGVVWPLAMFVSTLVTYVLIPDAIKKGDASLFFTPATLLMHNANVLMLIPELCVYKIPLASLRLSFLFLTLYFVWHQYVRYHRTRTLYYSIMNWSKTKHMHVLGGMACLLCSYTVCGHMWTSMIHGKIILVCLSLSVCRWHA